MKYRKQAHTRLHHTETHPHDDGTIRVEAHLIHRPPQHHQPGSGDNPQGHPIHHAYATGEDSYPNKVHTMTADGHEEAGEMVADIHSAHRYDPGRKRPKSPELEHGDHQVTAEEEYEEAG